MKCLLLKNVNCMTISICWVITLKNTVNLLNLLSIGERISHHKVQYVPFVMHRLNISMIIPAAEDNLSVRFVIPPSIRIALIWKSLTLSVPIVVSRCKKSGSVSSLPFMCVLTSIAHSISVTWLPCPRMKRLISRRIHISIKCITTIECLI